MLTTLKRDWWKLLIVILAYYIFSTQILKIIAKIYSGPRIWIVLCTGAIGVFISDILPTFIHEQKQLWSIAWKYLVSYVLLGMLYFMATSKTSITMMTWIKYMDIVVGQSLFLGFLCAVANTTGLWEGIKTLFTKYLKILICVSVILSFIDWLTIRTVYKLNIWAVINIAIIYICLPLFKKQNQ